MAGIYIHIPFCAQKCHYCDFYSIASKKYHGKFIESLVKEIRLRKSFLENETIETIYFGGGTPSLLTKKEIEDILNEIKKQYILTENPEITLEANPEDINLEYLKQIKEAGINRLSIGIQSFFDEHLLQMNRRHAAKKSIEAVAMAKTQGFGNISIDLIYGLPNMTLEQWEKNLEQAVKLDIQHISAYHLTIEEKTAFAFMKKKGRIKEIEEDLSLLQFDLLVKKLKEGGFDQYEISNFAKNNKISIHNSNYWKKKAYLGFGPSAHSFKNETRSWNKRGIINYIEAINKNTIPQEQEELSKVDQYNEYIITALRTKWGVNISYIKTFDKNLRNYFLKNIQNHIKNGHIKSENGIYTLTEKGIFISDAIQEDLFYVI